VFRLDLQASDLPDASVDLVLTPHVLEHVPDTDRALAELHRILVPGGSIHLQVPLLQAATAPPVTPEFHGDDTPVFWRFGWDLTERLRTHGFSTSVLVTRPFADAVRTDRAWPLPHSREFDVAGILAAAPPDDLVVVADTATVRQMGFEPGYMFVTWEARRPA
jgi:SAM-dependent methyltransferase